MLKSHKQTIVETLGRHPIHPFPARMAPGIALDALGDGERKLTVLDPMAGSGTVLAVACANGHTAHGVDIDPLAVLLAGVWTRPVDACRVKDKAAEILDRARGRFQALPVSEAYPELADEETREFIRYWFDGYARRQLASLATAIGRVRNTATREVLWCGFSRLIITKSSGASRAMDLSHSRPHRAFENAPIKPFNKFLSAVETVVSNCPQPDGESLPVAATVQLGDARKLTHADCSIDLVLTSPPYLNAIDYMRCSKFSLVWMGYNVSSLRQIRGESVGTEAGLAEATETDWVQKLIRQLDLSPNLSSRDQSLLAHYIWDMNKSLSEVSRVLRTGCRAVYVVGDSTIRGTFVRNSSIVVAVAKRNGLIKKSRQSRDLPENRRYMPPPKSKGAGESMDARMRKEVVLVFEKPTS